MSEVVTKLHGWAKECSNYGGLEKAFNDAADEFERMEDRNDRIGKWLSAALDDPNVCAEMKADIAYWFGKEAHARRSGELTT